MAMMIMKAMVMAMASGKVREVEAEGREERRGRRTTTTGPIIARMRDRAGSCECATRMGEDEEPVGER